MLFFMEVIVFYAIDRLWIWYVGLVFTSALTLQKDRLHHVFEYKIIVLYGSSKQLMQS